MDGARAVGTLPKAIAVLVLAMLASTALATGEDTQRTRGSLQRLEGGMAPATDGGAVRIEHALEGDTALVWGHEGPGDLRVVDAGLGTLGVLQPPSPGFRVKGASISEGGLRAFVWGSAAGAANDTIVTYNLTTFAAEPYIPDGLLGLATIDAVRSLAWGIILAVAGADANGTSVLLFVETVPMQVLRGNPLPGNASAQALGTDGVSMYCLLDDGKLVVVSTRNWTVERTVEVCDGPFSAWFITRSRWFLGGADGTVLVWNDYDKAVMSEMRMEGPVQGIARTAVQQNETLIVATPAPEGGSLLHAFRMWNVSVWKLGTKEEWPVAVTMLGAHPTRGDAVLVCGADGSVVPLAARTWTDYGGPKPRWPIYGGIAVAAIVVALVALRRSRRGRPEG